LRWSEIGAREIIDIYNGARLGRLDQADMIVDTETGQIEEVVVTSSEGSLAGFGRGAEARIPWNAVTRVGPQIVLVELSRMRDRDE